MLFRVGLGFVQVLFRVKLGFHQGLCEGWFRVSVVFGGVISSWFGFYGWLL